MFITTTDILARLEKTASVGLIQARDPFASATADKFTEKVNQFFPGLTQWVGPRSDLAFVALLAVYRAVWCSTGGADQPAVRKARFEARQRKQLKLRPIDPNRKPKKPRDSPRNSKATLGKSRRPKMKTKPPKSKQKKKLATMTPAALLSQAEALLHTGQPDSALPLATKALAILQPSSQNATPASLPALTLLAEINLELGSPSIARKHFLTAVSLDPDGSIPDSEGGGAEKFLWLAQLSEEGGLDSVQWFEKGAQALRTNIMKMVSDRGEEEAGDEVEGMMKRLASALCGIVETYMTDLSYVPHSLPRFPIHFSNDPTGTDGGYGQHRWDQNAEPTCEKLITEALLTAPTSPEPLQTLASIRVSQTRIPEAKTALSDSLALWKDLPPGDGSIPEFPTRVSLARLLMEVELEEDALMVLERLISEDDQSVEAWYLGGWCLYLLGQKRRKGARRPNDGEGMVDGRADGDEMDDDRDHHQTEDPNEREEMYTASLLSSREWLRQSLKLYELLEYEDDRLRDHALELAEDLDKELEGRDTDTIEEGDALEGAWESEDNENGDGDEEMDGT